MINQHGIFQHYKNGKKYLIENFCKIQENDVWVEAVIYHHIDNDEFLYVRSLKEFEEKFKDVLDGKTNQR